MRQVIAGRGVSVASLLAGCGLAILDLLLMWRVFLRTYRRAVRTGLIARFSAENTS
jgi:ABC-2 type transport system permease protein